jgi:serine phosphatase RsbU (regulator of sigma subunit)
MTSSGDTTAVHPVSPRATHGLSDVLEAAEAASPVDAVEAASASLSAVIGASRVSFLIADLSGRALVRLSHGGAARGARTSGAESADVLPFDNGLAERVIRDQRTEVVERAADWLVLAPVTHRGEVLGALEITLAASPSVSDIELITSTAHAVAFVVIASRRHTDLFEWGQRTTPFELSAEIQRRLLPAAFTCEAGSFALSAWLEPAATVGGDTFDYSLERESLHFSVTDAMGHGVRSALIATVCVSSLRNTRRLGGTVLEQAQAADEAVRVNTPDAFATGLLGRLDLPSGGLTLVNAGHVLPLLQRSGQISEIQLPPNLPFGIARGIRYRPVELQLRPGDRLIVLTDGMLERQASALDLEAYLATNRDLHPREMVRALADAVVSIAGADLADDATSFILDWHGGHGGDRHSRAGATRTPSWP